MKICTVTGSRAEFYILKNLIKKFENNRTFKHHLIVTGSHNSQVFGNTINQIKKEKIKIGSKIKILLNNDTELDISKSYAIAVKLFSEEMLRLKPDLLIILGDRYEIFAAAVAACFNRIPIAHIHGGEITEGVIDEALRHSITKMSHIHFVSTKEYHRNLIQLGENPKHIFNIGSLGVENLRKTALLNKKNLEKKLNIKFKKKNILITYHPETINSRQQNKKNLKELFKSLNKLKETSLIFTMPGADVNFKMIVKEIKNFIKFNKNGYFFKSLGDQIYFSLCSEVDLMIGNSSSGIIEMPSLKKPTINLGDRQKGRVTADSVINIDFESKKIKRKINYVYSKKFSDSLKKIINPYEKKDSSEKIIQVLKKIKLKNILNKKFYVQI